jgi:REP element-mobilizing transposase RayT
MSVETVVDQKGIYFVTFTCYKWIPLLEIADGFIASYRFFDAMKRAGHSLTGYVLMPNHLHCLLQYIPNGKTLNTVIGNGKRFIGYHIIDTLKKRNNLGLLQQLSDAVSLPERKRGKLHELWQPGFDVKACRTEKFLLQKLHYMHDNPITGKWNLAPSRDAYQHSSASYYLRGKHGRYEVVHYEKLLDWENMYQ